MLLNIDAHSIEIDMALWKRIEPLIAPTSSDRAQSASPATAAKTVS
jgi:hypothetical protein